MKKLILIASLLIAGGLYADIKVQDTVVNETKTLEFQQVCIFKNTAVNDGHLYLVTQSTRGEGIKLRKVFLVDGVPPVVTQMLGNDGLPLTCQRR